MTQVDEAQFDAWRDEFKTEHDVPEHHGRCLDCRYLVVESEPWCRLLSRHYLTALTPRPGDRWKTPDPVGRHCSGWQVSPMPFREPQGRGGRVSGDLPDAQPAGFPDAGEVRAAVAGLVSTNRRAAEALQALGVAAAAAGVSAAEIEAFTRDAQGGAVPGAAEAIAREARRHRQEAEDGTAGAVQRAKSRALGKVAADAGAEVNLPKSVAERRVRKDRSRRKRKGQRWSRKRNRY